MANTIMTAKNTFQDALVMDLAPDNTQATCLSNALNATLVTMNGNELSLQNDMGNGRVETAYLPEGYVPVGTCEFGDIIYIVSYNPLTNKSQIGCFPSPERNISSDEMGDKPQSITESDFIKDDNVINNSVKKILCSKDLNPGDKFIVYSTTALEKSAKIITDYGNTSETLYSFPKYLRIHLVAIEDSGKINYLDSNLKWYGTGDSHYYISSGANGINNTDVGSYRNLLSSGYSVFQSKVSGKLAILAELERIDGFSCTYDVYQVSEDEKIDQEKIYNNKYTIFLNCNWHTNNNDVNPSAIKISDVDWVSNRDQKFAGKYQILATEKEGYTSDKIAINSKYLEQQLEISTPKLYHSNLENYEKFLKCNFDTFVQGKSLEKVSYARNKGIPIPGSYYLDLTTIYNNEYYNSKNEIVTYNEIPDIIINNFYKSSFYKEFMTIDIPNIQVLKVNDELIQYPIDKQDLILKYVVTPKMEYGFLPDLAITSYIDFSKIGTGTINLNTYKYYIGENLCTLNLGTEIYPEENKGVEEILLEFYDNQGLCATYHINDRASYSGNIIEYIPLNGESSNYKLSNKDDNNQLIYHAGLQDNAGDVLINPDGKASKKSDDYKGIIYQNDSGILYSNMLYAVQIIIKYKPKNILGQYDSGITDYYKRYWRWMWTNTIFNDYYFTVKDFNENEVKLNLDISVDYKPEYKSEFLNVGFQENNDQTNLYKGLGSKIEHLKGSIKYKINLGLQNTYNTFSLEGSSNSGAVKDADIKVSIGDSYFTKNSQIIYTNNNLLSDNGLLNLSLDNNYSDLVSNYQNIANDNKYIKIYDTNGVQYYSPIGKISMDNGNIQEVQYISSKTSQINTGKYLTNTMKLSECYGDFKQSIQLDLWNPSNYLYLFSLQNKSLQVLNSLIDEYEYYGLLFDSSKKQFSFNNILMLWATDCHHGSDKDRYIIKLDPNQTLANTIAGLGDLNYLDSNSKTVWSEVNNLKKYVSGYYFLIGGGSATHSQFKSGMDYFLNSADRTEEWNFNLSSFNDGFFVNFTPLRWEHKDATYEFTGVTSRPVGLMQLAYKDTNGLHLFNHFDGGDTFGALSNICQPLVDLVISWMAQTFKLDSSVTNTTINSLYDVLYHKGQIIFNQDIIYEASLNTPSLVTIQGISYPEYLEKVIINSGKSIKSNNNTTIQFNSIQKTIPIQIILNYVLPNIPKEPIYKINYYGTDSTADWDCSQLVDGKLYQLNSDRKLVPIGNNQEIKYINDIDVKDNKFVFEFSNNTRQITMSNVFSYIDNHLVAKRSSPQTGSYNIHVDAGYEGGGYITDLLKADTIMTRFTDFLGNSYYQVT